MQTSEFDIIEYLDNPDMISEYLNLASEESDEAFIMAVGDVARLVGISRVAEETGLGRTSLYKTTSGSVQPQFTTVRAILRSLNLKLTVSPM